MRGFQFRAYLTYMYITSIKSEADRHKKNFVQLKFLLHKTGFLTINVLFKQLKSRFNLSPHRHLRVLRACKI